MGCLPIPTVSNMTRSCSELSTEEENAIVEQVRALPDHREKGWALDGVPVKKQPTVCLSKNNGLST